MLKSEISISYILLTNRIQKLNYRFAKVLGVAPNIFNKLCLLKIYRNLHAKDGVCSYYKS